MKAFAITVVALLVACGGGRGGGGNGGVGDECSTSNDCNDELGCSGPNDGPVCGIPPREGCGSDLDCNPGGSDRCHAIEDPCSADGIGSECRPLCTIDGDCGGGFRCDAGACVALACDAGFFTCQAREDCDPSRIAPGTPVFNRHHGCFAVNCANDDECDAQFFCVNGTCQDDVGVCAEPMLVP